MFACVLVILVRAAAGTNQHRASSALHAKAEEREVTFHFDQDMAKNHKAFLASATQLSIKKGLSESTVIQLSAIVDDKNSSVEKPEKPDIPHGDTDFKDFDVTRLKPRSRHYRKWQDMLKQHENKSPWVVSSVLVMLAVIAIFSGVTYAILGLGTALVFHALLRIIDVLDTSIPSVGVDQAAIYMMCAQPFITIFQAISLRDSKRNVPFIGTYGASTFIGLGGGLALLEAAGPEANNPYSFVLRLVLLFSCFMTLGNEAYKWSKVVREKDLPEEEHPLSARRVNVNVTSTIIVVVVCGALAGFLQGAIAVGGTFKMLMIVTLGISNEEWRSTQCMADLPLQLARFIFVCYTGMVDFNAELFSIVGVIVGMSIGACIGNSIAKYVPHAVFNLAVLMLIFLAAVVMIAQMFMKHEVPGLG